MKYLEYEPEQRVTCRHCGWEGVAGGHEDYGRLGFAIECPRCLKSIFYVTYPADDDIKAEARLGNPKAIEMLGEVSRREEFHAKAGETEMDETTEFPEIEGDDLVVEWDFEERNGERRVVLRHKGMEIGREMAYWEGYERFSVVSALLVNRYGKRLRALRPSEASWPYLLGDSLSARQHIEDLNTELSRWREEPA